jgi:hypothetical protein
MIAQTIQLALAPVFVLVAIGGIMNMLSHRLGRVVDRSRSLQGRHGSTEGMEHDMIVREMRVVDRRLALLNRALLLLVLSGLTIGVTVVLLFMAEFMHVDMQVAAASTFMVAVLFMMAALLLFLHETRLATAALKIPETYLELERNL